MVKYEDLWSMAISIVLLLLLVACIAAPLVLKQGFENPSNSINAVNATGPPLQSGTGPSSTGASPVGPNIPDPASHYATGINGGSNDTTNAPALGKPSNTSGNSRNSRNIEGFENPSQLLPSDPHMAWASVNPRGSGAVAGKNYLNAGALISVNTVGQSLRNASFDLRSEPANPQVALSPWFNSTIEPDVNRLPLEFK